MKLKYKKIRVSVPFCPICDEQLQGSNSLAFPYKCKCGIWKRDMNNVTEWNLVKVEE